MNRINSFVRGEIGRSNPFPSVAARMLALGIGMETKEGERSSPELKAIEELNTKYLAKFTEFKEWCEKATAEIAGSKSISNETKAAAEKAFQAMDALGLRIDKIEAKGNRPGGGVDVVKTIGEQFIECDSFKSLIATKSSKGVARMEVKNIYNATGQNQPLVPDMRVPGIQILPNRRLRIRQLLPVGKTESNLVQYTKENVFTNAAGPQNAGASPSVAAEGALKNQSDITFTLANAPVVTLAHFILASRQVLSDAPMLGSYIDGRLQYGLALEEENELLNGDGLSNPGSLIGLMSQATGYNRQTQLDTRLDILRRALTQLQLSEFDAEFIVLNPSDWEGIELTKDNQGRYIIANPQSMLGPQIWGLPVVPTNSMTKGHWLVANGTMACQIWDRQEAAVQISLEDSDNFRRNLVTMLCEERLALTVYRGAALIKGDFVNP